MSEGKFVWNVASTTLLISEYKEYEMLYNGYHQDYKNRNKRLNVYKKIAAAISATSGDGCTVEDVKRKINGLRSQYLAEKMKILNSLKSGADGDDVYKPTVYWFPLMKFLEQSTNPDESQTNIGVSCNPEVVERGGAVVEEERTPNLSDNSNAAPSNASIANAKSTSETVSLIRNPTKRAKKMSSYDNLLVQPTNTMTHMSDLVKVKRVSELAQDPIDTFGQFIVGELKSIQRASNEVMLRQVKKKIQQVLMDTWDVIDSQSFLPNCSASQASSSHRTSVTSAQLHRNSNSSYSLPTPEHVEEPSLDLPIS